MGRFYEDLANEQPTKNLFRKQLLFAKSNFEKAIQIRSRIYGPRHPDTVLIIDRLAPILHELSQG
jgi:hypothetical protein